MSSSSQTVSRRDFWTHHIKSSEAHEGGSKEYCQIHGLNPGTLNSYRSRLGYSKPQKKSVPSPFVPVNIYPKPQSNLPDPIWLAKFLKALGEL